MKTLEEKRLAPAAACLESVALQIATKPSGEAQLQVLEAAAARLGGFRLESYHEAFQISPLAPATILSAAADSVVREIVRAGLIPSLALSALAREPLDRMDKRTSGAWHTDYRLAIHLSGRVAKDLSPNSRVVDPASGSGMLLASLLISVCGADKVAASKMVRNGITAGDLSASAIRGTCLVLASICGNVAAVVKFRARCNIGDSLLAYGTENGFQSASYDAVIANPPWDKVKAVRHEHLLATGIERHYGSSVQGDFDEVAFNVERCNTRNHASQIAARFPSIQGGEVDLYVAFTDLALNLLAPNGVSGIIVPGGLIRSQGTQFLRRRLFNEMENVEIAIHDNKGAHFAVDSRLKFLTVTVKKGSGIRTPISFRVARTMLEAVTLSPSIKVGRKRLAQQRPDLTIPEVKNQAEWSLFSRLAQSGHDWSLPTSNWHPQFCREVDMSRQRRDFEPGRRGHGLDLVEGRMVQPHRLGAKAHVTGEGRAANWTVIPPGLSRLLPQFRIPFDRLSMKAKERTVLYRVGFCDVTGQTNERTMMTAMIPPGIVCGNKVPTIIFPNEPSEDRLWLFLALTNSLVYDWMIRRVTTTTINYFVALSVPLPPVEPESLPGRRLIEIAQELHQLDRQGAASTALLRRLAALRAEADILVAIAWGISPKEMYLVLDDFPLLDRGQTPLSGEHFSTITKDLLISRFLNRAKHNQPAGLNLNDDGFDRRVEDAVRNGSIPYIASEFSQMLINGRVDKFNAV